MATTIDRGDFWEFKARCAEIDLEIAKARATLKELTASRNALVDAFAQKHGFDPSKPIVLDDVALTAAQPSASPPGTP